tara:strand:- start:90 stop:320 length:231 start_codon:yes stop_codon:yes gene_type:complete
MTLLSFAINWWNPPLGTLSNPEGVAGPGIWVFATAIFCKMLLLQCLTVIPFVFVLYGLGRFLSRWNKDFKKEPQKD